MFINNSNLLTSLYNTQQAMQISSLRLSTGLRINSAADDPAGLAIATRMQSQINSTTVGNQNIDSAQSLLQTADGAASQLSSIAQSMKSLALQADDGTLSTADRTSLNSQMTDLKSEYDNIVSNTTYNGINIMNNSNPLTINTGTGGSFTLNLSDATSGGSNVNLQGMDISTQAGAESAMTQIDTAIDGISNIRSSYGSQMNALTYRTDFNNTYNTSMQSSYSNIMDANMATEMSNLTKQQLQEQANVQMLQTVDSINSSFLTLLSH